jgi:hypothetical protein
LDLLLVTALIFFLWLAAKKTKKLLKRLEPEEKLCTREMIIIKKELAAVGTHLAEPEDKPAAEPEPVAAGLEAAAELTGPAFEVDEPQAEAEMPAAAGEWKEIELTVA